MEILKLSYVRVDNHSTEKNAKLVKDLSASDVCRTIDIIATRVIAETDLPNQFKDIGDPVQMLNPTSTAIDTVGKSNVGGVKINELGYHYSQLFLIFKGHQAGVHSLDESSKENIIITQQRNPRYFLVSLVEGKINSTLKLDAVHENLHHLHFSNVSKYDHVPNNIAFLFAEVHAHYIDTFAATHVDSVSKKMQKIYKNKGITPDNEGFYETYDVIASHLQRKYDFEISNKAIYELTKWIFITIDLAVASGKVTHKDIAEKISNIRHMNKNTFYGLATFVRLLNNEIRPLLDNETVAYKTLQMQEKKRRERYLTVKRIATEEVGNAVRSLYNL